MKLFNNKKNFVFVFIVFLYVLSFSLIKQIVKLITCLNFGKSQLFYVYAICIMLTAFGYFLFYMISKRSDNAIKKNFVIGIIFLPAILLCVYTTNVIIYTCLFALFSISYGYIGGFICYFLYKKYNDMNNKGLLCGLGISVALLIQLVLTIVINNFYYLFVVMYICIIILNIITFKEELKNETIDVSKPKYILDNKHKIVAVLIVILMSVIIGIQDGLVVRFNTFENIRIYSLLKIAYIV